MAPNWLQPTWFLIEPQAPVEIAADLLRLAVDAIEDPLPRGVIAMSQKDERACRLEVARAFARACDWTAFEWFWWEGGNEWGRRRGTGPRATYTGPKASPSIPSALKREVALRDNFTCRYCQLRVVSSATLTALEKLVPAALPTGDRAVESHPMQCVLRLTWDHVIPRSAGGQNTVKNIVTACGGCNYNKGSSTLEELGLRHPLDRDRVENDWDGLNGRLNSRAI
jgi:5-methylcytosine-specific restriction endonuclease McrA